MSLFDAAENARRQEAQPLAARMRPRRLDEFVGQSHFLGEGKLLRRLIAADRLGSLIFYGPPGTGKTSLARLLASETQSTFRQLSAVTSNVKSCAKRSTRPATGSRRPAARPCSLSTRSIASTRPSRTCSCRKWKRAW